MINRFQDYLHEESEFNRIVLDKVTEKYIISYTDENKVGALSIIGNWVSNPELSFTWDDFVILSDLIDGKFNKKRFHKGPKDNRFELIDRIDLDYF
ncbi:Uncharacterised protein [uncultured archaeon]|nr:Uncharacterised protein [uncultured archaeon]